MAKSTNWMPIIVVALIIGGIVWAVNTGFFKAQVTPGEPGYVAPPGLGFATTLQAGSINAITGDILATNAQPFYTDGTSLAGETAVTGLPTSLATVAPNTMTGYLLIGNDANQHSTDRGAEAYVRKVPFTYTQKATYTIPDTDGKQWIKIYNESSCTWTGYDDGSAETNLNISVGSGQTITSTELKMASGSDACLGNPEINRPLGVCFNATTLKTWDEIRPANYVGTFDPCDVWSGYNMLDTCYILDTPAICDYEEFRFYIILDAATGENPAAAGTNDQVYAHFVDKTWRKSDDGSWIQNWCDNSAEGTDYDPGISGIANTKQIGFT